MKAHYLYRVADGCILKMIQGSPTAAEAQVTDGTAVLLDRPFHSEADLTHIVVEGELEEKP